MKRHLCRITYLYITDIETETAEDGETGLSHWFGNNKIAFSTYLSRRYNHLGKGQHVKFDKVLLNDGDGYEASTGVFRLKCINILSFVVCSLRLLKTFIWKKEKFKKYC
jgi:hypothetical protein